MMLHFLNDVTNEADPYKNKKLRHNHQFEE